MQIGTVITVIVFAAALGAALGLFLGRYVWPTPRRGDIEALAAATTRLTQADQDCESLRKRLGQTEASNEAAVAEAKALATENAGLKERVLGQTTDIAERTAQVTSLEAQRTQLAEEAKTALAEAERLKEREKNLSEKLDTQKVQLSELQQQLTAEFENIAGRVLKANTAELSQNSQTALTALLTPLRERIQDFQKKVEATYDAETREVLSLKEQIRLVLETSNTVGSQADGLAKALRGDSQVLGRWGELALERILETAGLTEGREYVAQGRGLHFKSESGGAQKPDVVIMLPEKRTMIIDSKAPLTSYERLIAAKDETERGACADQLVRDFKSHIDGLAGKRYQEAVGTETLQAHDCVLMFVPIEGALAAALTREPELFSYAWRQHVVLVGPPTLMMTLRTVASIWRYELQGRNAQDIARLAGDLCDKVSSSLSDLNTVAEKIRGALDTHNEAVKRLATGKGNVLSLGDRIRTLGVKTKKVMPTMQIDGVALPPVTIEDETELEEPASAVLA